MVAGYPGQHWLGRDPHRPVQPPPIEALEDVATPALVAVGDRDVPGFREMSAVLARRIPGAEYRVVAGAGHMVNMEQPAAVNELLTRFLAGLPAPATERPSEQAEELTEQGDERWSR
jgi:pimeloyl-ACP methyl ester carboxylesterase